MGSIPTFSIIVISPVISNFITTTPTTPTPASAQTANVTTGVWGLSLEIPKNVPFATGALLVPIVKLTVLPKIYGGVKSILKPFQVVTRVLSYLAKFCNYLFAILYVLIYI